MLSFIEMWVKGIVCIMGFVMILKLMDLARHTGASQRLEQEQYTVLSK